MSPSLKAVTGLSLAAFAACAAGGGAPASAKTFVYVSNAQDGNIDAYVMDKASGALTPVGKAVAAKLVMPMAVSPDSHAQKVIVDPARLTPVLRRAIGHAHDAEDPRL